MSIYVLIPILLVGASFAYSRWAVQRAQQLSPQAAAGQLHDFFSGYFEMEPNEVLVGVWSGVAYTGAKTELGRLGGAALNQAAKGLLGVATYTPQVHVGLTSTGRVLVSCEHSVMGQRGNFEQVVVIERGAQALDAAALRPGLHPGAAPLNTSNPNVGLQYVCLRGQGHEFEAWLSPEGVMVGRPGFHPIQSALGS